MQALQVAPQISALALPLLPQRHLWVENANPKELTFFFPTLTFF